MSRRSLSLVNEFNPEIVGLGEIASELAEEFPLFEAPILRPQGSSLELVQTGKIDALVTSLYYWQDKYPALATLSGVPFGLSPEEMYTWAWNDGREYYDRLGEMFNLKILPMYFTPSQVAGWFKTNPIPTRQTARPFEGLRIRMPSYGGRIMEMLGANIATQSLNIQELKDMLQSDELDMVEWVDARSDFNAGWYEYAPYALTPGWHERSTVGQLLINQDTWDSLSATTREEIEDYAVASGGSDLAFSQAEEGQAYREIAEVATILRFPDWILELMQGAWLRIQEEIDDPLFKEILASQQSLQEDVQTYQQIQEL